jgi:hypothetical protein
MEDELAAEHCVDPCRLHVIAVVGDTLTHVARAAALSRGDQRISRFPSGKASRRQYKVVDSIGEFDPIFRLNESPAYQAFHRVYPAAFDF